MSDHIKAALDAAATALGGLALAAIGAIFLGVGCRLFFVNRNELTKNALRFQGMKYCEKKKAIIPQRRLSHEAIRAAFKWRF